MAPIAFSPTGIRFQSLLTQHEGGTDDGLPSSIPRLQSLAKRRVRKGGGFKLLCSYITTSSDGEGLVSKLNLGSLGYTKTVAAEVAGVNAAE